MFGIGVFELLILGVPLVLIVLIVIAAVSAAN